MKKICVGPPANSRAIVPLIIIGRFTTTSFFGKIDKSIGMKSILSVFLGLGLLAAPIILAQMLQGNTPATAWAQDSSDEKKASPAKKSTRAETILRQAIRKTESWTTIESKIRQKLSLFDKQLFGSGIYIEQLSPLSIHSDFDRTQFRLELRIQPPSDSLGQEEPNTLISVCDRRYVWKYTSMTGEKPSLERIDVERLKKAIALGGQAEKYRRIQGIPATGGLAGTLRQLENFYVFDLPPEEPMLGGQIAAWRLKGRLRSDQKKRMTERLHQNSESPNETKKKPRPEQIATDIVIFLGKDDLFPYRLEYYRRVSEKQELGEPFLTMEIFEVRLDGEGIPSSIFHYLPGENIHPHNLTDEFIEKLKLPAPPKAEEPALPEELTSDQDERYR